MALTPQGKPRWQMRFYSFNLAGSFAGTAGFTDQGEIIGATDRSFTFQLNKPDTISFKLPIQKPMATTIAAAQEGYVLLYRNGTLMMICEIDTIEVVGQDGEHSVSVTCMETMWSRLQTALIGVSSAGQLGPSTATDQGTWLNSILTAYNSATVLGLAQETYIRAGTVTASNSITGGVWRYKPFMELVQEMSASLAGFDFWQTPLDPALNAGVTGNLNMAPVKGSVKSNVVFEYGTGASNAASYRYLVDSSQMANFVYVLPPGFPDNAGLKSAAAADATAVGNRNIRYAMVDSDLNDYTLRTSVASLHVGIRGKPRRQVMIQPAYDDGSGRVPSFGVDYVLGDTVTAHVKDQGVVLINAGVRVYNANITLDAVGQEAIALGLVNEA